MKTNNLIIAGLSMAALSGCATITKGTEDVVQVEVNNCSEPIKCTATNKKGSWEFTAPRPVKFTKSDDDLNIACEDGESIITRRISPTQSSMVWGNVLFGGIIGGGVDASTDAHWEVPDSTSINRVTCFGKQVN